MFVKQSLSATPFRGWAGPGLFISCLLLALPAWGKGKQVNDYQWEGVERIVAVGDLHGDYAQYRKVLRDAGLINERGKWIGGSTHLVQTGDITDRGPDSIAILENLEDLKKQSRRKGGGVHTLIGNHEAMNSYGDLRYVHEGEYEHFVDRDSEALRERQWEYTLQRLQQSKPEEFAVLDLALYRADWEKQFPLGWVEHRTAWVPSGEYGRWLQGNPVVLKINDTLFVHGGLSAKYCQLSLAEFSERAHAELENFDGQNPGMIEDPEGPLWYRGLAQDDEDSLRPVVDAILERYQAARIVIGHSPTGGVVWPRFEGRVIANDTGIAAYYGGHDAFLEISGSQAVAGYGDKRLDVPSEPGAREPYLRAVMALDPENGYLEKRLERMLAPPVPGQGEEPMGEQDELRDPEAEILSPDICR